MKTPEIRENIKTLIAAIETKADRLRKKEPTARKVQLTPAAAWPFPTGNKPAPYVGSKEEEVVNLDSARRMLERANQILENCS